MSQECDRFDSEGFSVVMDMNLPILGTYSTQMYTLGDKFKGVVDGRFCRRQCQSLEKR